MAHLEELWGAVAALDPTLAYAILFGVAVLENILPILPGDALIVCGSYLVGQGHLLALPLLVGTTLGSSCGFMIMYYLGATKGRAFFTNRRRSLLTKRHIRRAERWFAKYGDNVVLVNRFLAGARSVVAVMAGIGNMPPGKALLFATISALIWNALLISLGAWLATNWRLAVRLLREYNIVVSGVLIVLVALLVLRRRTRRRR